MIIIAGTIQINPEGRKSTITAIRQMMADSQAEEGCIAYEFSADLTAPDILHLFEVWESAEALEAHRNSSHMAAFKQEIGPKFVKIDTKRYIGEVAG